MNTLKKLSLATLAAFAAALLLPASIMQADDRGQGNASNNRGRDQEDAKATFTKWLIGSGPNMEGVVGGAVGNGAYTGEILKYQIVSRGGATIQTIEALYNFHGSKHSFTALVHVEQTGSGIGTKAVIIGVVTDGWRKGHAVEGKYTEKSFIHGGVPTPYFEGSLEIKGEAID